MRTMLDPDTEQSIRARMLRDQVTFERALDDAVRDGLGAGHDESIFETPTFATGSPRVDLTKALRLVGELEDDELIAQLRRGA